MKKLMAISVILLTVLSTLAILSSEVKTTSLQFRFEPLIDSPVDEAEPYILQDSTNKIWVFFSYENKTVSDHYKRIFYITSVDGGNTWSDPSLFLPAYMPGRYMFQPVAFQDSTGRFWVAWLNHTATHNADQVWFTTSNDGKNWTRAKLLCDGHNDMGGFVEACGKVWFFFSPLSSYWRVSYKTTEDGGNTWSDLAEATTESGMRSPHPTVLTNGTIFVVYRVGAYHYEANIGYSASSDCGGDWSHGLVTDPPYPEWDGESRVTEYNENIYVSFSRSYDQVSSEQDVWLRVYNSSKKQWEDPQPVTDGSISPSNGQSSPTVINDKLWIAFQVYIDLDLAIRDIWLAKTCLHIGAIIDIDPDTLNLKSNGKFVTAYIELPEGYDVVDIDLSTVQLEGIPAINDTQYGFVTDPASYLMDHDGDGVLERMVKFDRTTVRETLTGMIDYEEGVKFYDLTLTVTGELVDGTQFEGTDTITVIKK